MSDGSGMTAAAAKREKNSGTGRTGSRRFLEEGFEKMNAHCSCGGHSTVTLLARFRGLSTSQPRSTLL